MNTQEQKWFNHYLSALKIAGRATPNIRYSLKLFFKYTFEQDILFLNLTLTEAQAYQTYLMTLTDEHEKIKYHTNTVITLIGSLTGFYDYLKEHRIIFKNPFSMIKKPRKIRSLPRNILDEKKMALFLGRLRQFWQTDRSSDKRQLYKAHIICELLYSTGMRINEVMKLTAEDINLDRGTVKITDSKTGQSRYGLLNEYTCKIVRIYLHEIKDALIAKTGKGDKSLLFGSKVYLKSWLNTILQRESKKLGLGPFSSHNFRHAVGFHLLRAGCDIRYIQELLGHKDLGSTQIYTRVEKENLRDILDSHHPRVFKRRQGIKHEKS